jgi:hypothetical protein
VRHGAAQCGVSQGLADPEANGAGASESGAVMTDPAWPIFEWFLWGSAIAFWSAVAGVVVLVVILRIVGRRNKSGG